MRRMVLSLLALLAVAIGFTSSVSAGDADPLFVNLTTSEAHRAQMAIGFGAAQLERGHPLTIFLNDQGVLLASKAQAPRFAQHQKALSDAMAKGATVIACPTCMKKYGIKDADLLHGVQVGKPELTGGMLFKAGTRTLSW